MSEFLKPGETNQLSIAESAQLSLDYNRSPEAFNAAQRFYGIHIDELEFFKTALDKHYKMVADQDSRVKYLYELKVAIKEKRLVPYNVMDYNVSAGESLVSQAIAAAFLIVHTNKHELIDNTEKLNDQGQEVSDSFRSYMLQKVPQLEGASLNGTNYIWNSRDDKIMLTQYKSGDRMVKTFFGNTESYVQFSHKYSYEGSPVIPHLVTPYDWNKLVKDLEKTSLY